MTDPKHTDIAEPTPEWIEDQCQKFEATLAGFAEAMRLHFREKAREGRGRWLRADCAPALYQAMLAHAVAMPLAAGAEAHCANYLLFLWRLNREHPELVVRPDPGPRPMLSGYGLKADRELVQFALQYARENWQVVDGCMTGEMDPAVVIEEINRRAGE